MTPDDFTSPERRELMTAIVEAGPNADPDDLDVARRVTSKDGRHLVRELTEIMPSDWIPDEIEMYQVEAMSNG